jgi:PAS domain S-box-containing protein
MLTQKELPISSDDDKDGILFESHHPDMVLRKSSGDESCKRCHRSFNYAKQILEKKEGAIRYQVGNVPEKLAAFTSIEWEGQSWRLVMASDYGLMTAFSKRSLKGHLTLLSIFVFVLITSSVLIHRHDRSRIQAEEEVKHWREKEILENRARENQERYRMLVETMNAGLGIMDEKGIWTYVNDRLCKMVDHSRDEMIGRPVTEFLDREGQQIYEDQMAKRRKGYLEPYVTTGVRKDGQRLFVRISPKSIFDDQGAFRGSFAVITDITALKRTEEALRESEKHTLLMAQEKERGRFQRMHDELGSSWPQLRLKFLRRTERTEKVRQECEQSFQYIDQVIEEVRRLSRDLSPSMVEDFGLSNALRWLINNFGRNNSLELTLNIQDADIDHLLSQEAQVVIYRILQEALTNIGKHAQASHVSVAIDRQDKDLSLLVKDDGKGFDVTEALRSKAPSKGLGLVTMQERAKMLGGTLEIWSQKGKGTRISLHF